MASEETPSCNVPGVARAPIYKGEYSFNTGHISQLEVADYVIVVATLVVSTMIGFYQGWKHRTSFAYDLYVLAGRTMSALPVSLSIVASFISPVTLMGSPVQIYTFGTMPMYVPFCILIFPYITTTIYLPVMYRLGISSSFKYLEKRFNSRVRLVAVVLFITQMIAYMPLVLYGPVVAMNSVFGLNVWGTIFMIVLPCTAYVTVGGIKASIYTDAFQMTMIFVGTIAVLIQSTIKVGSASTVWESLRRSGRLIFHNFSPDPANSHSFWIYFIWGTTLTLSAYAVHQNTVQRYQACSSLKVAKWSCWLSGIILSSTYALVYIAGMFMSTFYEKCDPGRAGLANSSNEYILIYVMDIFHGTHMSGLFLAAMFSGTLSTMSSCLNSVSFVVVEDLVKPYIKQTIRDTQSRYLMQLICAVLGFVALELTYMVSTVENLFDTTTTLFSALGMPVLAVYSLGMLVPHATNNGAFCGLVGSFLFVVTSEIAKIKHRVPTYGVIDTCVSNCNLTMLSNATKKALRNYKPTKPVNLDDYNPLLTMSSYYYLILCLVFCIVFGMVVSLFEGFRDPQEINPRLIVPVFDVLFPLYYLPERMRHRLRFGINHSSKWDNTTATASVSKVSEVNKHVEVVTVPDEIEHASISDVIARSSIRSNRTSCLVEEKGAARLSVASKNSVVTRVETQL